MICPGAVSPSLMPQKFPFSSGSARDSARRAARPCCPLRAERGTAPKGSERIYYHSSAHAQPGHAGWWRGGRSRLCLSAAAVWERPALQAPSPAWGERGTGRVGASGRMVLASNLVRKAPQSASKLSLSDSAAKNASDSSASWTLSELSVVLSGIVREWEWLVGALAEHLETR